MADAHRAAVVARRPEPVAAARAAAGIAVSAVWLGKGLSMFAPLLSDPTMDRLAHVNVTGNS